MPRDALARLARLRALEERAAAVELARRLGARHEAEQASRAAMQAIVAEAASAAPADFARWLPRALAERKRARARATAAGDAADAARGLMAEAMQARRLVDEAMARRRAAAEAEALRRAQHALDDLTRGRRRS